jgi:hypothetical protein
MPGHDAVIAWRQAGETFHLLDIAGRDIPTLRQIISAVRTDAKQVAVHFPTDRLGWTGEPERYKSSCELMVTGDVSVLLHSGPVMLSPMSAF